MSYQRKVNKKIEQKLDQGHLEVIQNGSVTDAVNFAVIDFYRAAATAKIATDGFTKPHYSLPLGVQSFVSQQFFRMETASTILAKLGFREVISVMSALHISAVRYMDETMNHWNEVMKNEGEVDKIYQRLQANIDFQNELKSPADMVN